MSNFLTLECSVWCTTPPDRSQLRRLSLWNYVYCLVVPRVDYFTPNWGPPPSGPRLPDPCWGQEKFVWEASFRPVTCTLYTVHCTLYTVHCTVYNVQCTVYTVHCTLYTIKCTLYTIHCTLYTLHCTLYTVQTGGWLDLPQHYKCNDAGYLYYTCTALEPKANFPRLSCNFFSFFFFYPEKLLYVSAKKKTSLTAKV